MQRFSYFYTLDVQLMPYRFPKEEKLKSRKRIELLFQKGQSVASFPVRLVYLFEDAPADSQVQAAFSVPKRHFKKAVDRNRIKRQLREAYRLQKNMITPPASGSLILMFIYTGKEMPLWPQVQQSVAKLLSKLPAPQASTSA